MLVKKIYLTVLLLFFFSLLGTAQVILQSSMPAVGMVQRTQLWNVQLSNNSRTSIECRIEIFLRDRLTGQDLFSATSGVFTVKPGVMQLNERLLSPVQYNYISTGINTRMSGILPAGAYTTCYLLTGIGIKETALAEECLQFDVEPLSPPLLINPADSTVLEKAPLHFSWIPPAPVNMFDKLNYRFVLTEVKYGQTAAEAIQENLPVYTEDFLLTNYAGYPASAPRLENDKWYAWQVLASDNNNYAAKTETWVFKIAENKIEKIIKGTPYAKLKLLQPDWAIAPQGVLKISYDNQQGDSVAVIAIKKIGSGVEPTKTFSAALTLGENLIEYPLKKLIGLENDQTYEAALSNSKGEIWKILFKIKMFTDGKLKQ